MSRWNSQAQAVIVVLAVALLAMISDPASWVAQADDPPSLRATAELRTDGSIRLTLDVRHADRTQSTTWSTLRRARVSRPSSSGCYWTSPTFLSAALYRARICLESGRESDTRWRIHVVGSAPFQKGYSVVDTGGIVSRPRKNVRYLSPVAIADITSSTTVNVRTKTTASARSSASQSDKGSTDAATSTSTTTTGRRQPSGSGTTVTRIIDGDTIEVRDCSSCRPYRIRLADVWAPETHEPGGASATSRLRNIIPVGTRISFERTQADSYGRRVGVVRVGASGGSVNSRMRAYGYTNQGSGSASRSSSRATAGGASSSSNDWRSRCDTSQRTYRGQAGYHPSQDRDGDGIGCECGCRRR